MTAHKYKFRIEGGEPPVIEIDSEAMGIYIRFRNTAVAKSIDQQAKGITIVLDLDADGEVVGIESIGGVNVSLKSILEAASVNAPGIDFIESPYIHARSLAVAWNLLAPHRIFKSGNSKS